MSTLYDTIVEDSYSILVHVIKNTFVMSILGV